MRIHGGERGPAVVMTEVFLMALTGARNRCARIGRSRPRRATLLDSNILISAARRRSIRIFTAS